VCVAGVAGEPVCESEKRQQGKKQGLTPGAAIHAATQRSKGCEEVCSDKAFGKKGMTCFANIAVMASVLFALFTTGG
jgi:hypothetical protein